MACTISNPCRCDERSQICKASFVFIASCSESSDNVWEGGKVVQENGVVAWVMKLITKGAKQFLLMSLKRYFAS